MAASYSKGPNAARGGAIGVVSPGDLFDRQNAHARRSQLDRQRQTVQQPHQVGDRTDLQLAHRAAPVQFHETVLAETA